MKELTALQSVLEILGAQRIDQSRDAQVGSPFYVITIYPNSIDLQGVFTTTTAGLIMKKFPDATSKVEDFGYVRLQFEHDGFLFKVCLT